MVAKRPPYAADWHGPSDQPRRVSDAGLKRALRLVALPEYLRTGVVTALIGPLVALRFAALAEEQSRPNAKRPSRAPRDFIGLGLTPGSAPLADLVAMVEDLGVRRLLVRVPVWDRDRFADYARFIAALPGREVLVVAMQDRGSVLDPARWRDDLRRMFAAFPTVKEFQIGQAVNRMKWGVLHLGEYFRLAEAAEDLRREHPDVVLVGPSLIDFEPLAMLGSLLTHRRFRFDAVAAALYVDRRGAPGNTQYGIFDLANKIRLQSAIAALSPRLRRAHRGRLWITETNWPISGTGESAPTSAEECVDEQTYADYLRAYYQQAHGTGLVERVYWWQLVAAGYGLVDPRGGQLRKRPGYTVFKHLLDGTVELGFAGSRTRRLTLDQATGKTA